MEKRLKDSLGGFGCGSDDGEVAREFINEDDCMSVIAWAKGASGMILFERICCPATPNFVLHCCLNAWRKSVQLSCRRSNIIGVVDGVGFWSIVLVSKCRNWPKRRNLNGWNRFTYKVVGLMKLMICERLCDLLLSDMCMSACDLRLVTRV